VAKKSPLFFLHFCPITSDDKQSAEIITLETLLKAPEVDDLSPFEWQTQS